MRDYLPNGCSRTLTSLTSSLIALQEDLDLAWSMEGVVHGGRGLWNRCLMVVPLSLQFEETKVGFGIHLILVARKQFVT